MLHAHIRLLCLYVSLVTYCSALTFSQVPANATRQLADKIIAAKTDAERDALLGNAGALLTPELIELLAKNVEEKRVKGDLDQALRLIRATLTYAERLGDPAALARAVHNSAMIYFNLGDFEPALVGYQRSLVLMESLKNQRGISNSLSGIGLIYRTLGDFDEAMKFYKRGLAAAEAAQDKAVIGNTLNLMGVTYRLQGNRRLALEYFQKALALFKETNYQTGVIGVLNNIGNVYLQQSQFDLAQDSFTKSLELATSAKYRPQVSLALNNIGRVHHIRGDRAKALEYYQQSLALREELGDKTGATRTLINLAELYKDLKDYDRSEEYYKKSLERLESSGNKADLPVTISGLGQLQLLRGNPKSALEWLNRATELAREGERLDVLWLALSITGKAHRDLKQEDQARAAFTESIEVVEELRRQIAGAEQEQQLFLEDKLSPYQSLVALFVDRNEWQQAFSMSEQAKARVLLDVLQFGRTSMGQMTSAEREVERKLRGSMVTINNQLLRETQVSPINDNRIADLKARRQQSRLAYESFRTNLYATHPELKKQRGEILPISLEQVGNLIADTHGALLEFSLAGDKAFLFVLTKSAPGKSPAKLKVYQLAVGAKELAQQADNFRLTLAQRDLTYASAARELYKTLLGPAEAELRGKTNLVIVPDGKLWDLPFQALQNSRGRHLIEDFAISYAPSLTVLREMKQLRQRKQLKNAGADSLLAIGNPSRGEAISMNGPSTSEKPDDLIETQRQVSALAELYGRSRSRVYTGDMARESRVKAEAGDYRVLQLATHGVLNDAAPMYSYVVLAREESGAEDDGLLEAWELMNMNLNSDLVSLSGCETARGRTSAGEGVIGLSWALFVAGSPTTLVSQWKVESASTTDLMLEFHRQLHSFGSHGSKSIALQRAAKKILNNVQYRHPFYWAGFVVVGDAGD